MNARDIFLPEYRKGVRDFIDFAQHKADSASWIKYPCKKYVNIVYHHIILVEEHLLHYSMNKKYTCWISHREDDPNEVMHDDDDTEDDSDTAGPIEHNSIEELLDDLHQGACSNVCMNIATSESNSDYKHNIWLEVE